MTEPVPSDAADMDQWSDDDLERAYQRALTALDAMDTSVQAVEAAAEQMAAEISGEAGATKAAPAPTVAVAPADVKKDDPQVSSKQVIEACLFVGGAGLTARKLATVLRGDYTAEFVEETIETLNQQYAMERRPYEIELGEGGYLLTLREEHERIRFKAFGLGPKEVRLSQEALEILAVVAYQQPITEEEIGGLGKPNSGGVLRQLLRRELIAVERSPEAPKVIRYVTTERFLSLFGIGDTDELPRPEEIQYK